MASHYESQIQHVFFNLLVPTVRIRTNAVTAIAGKAFAETIANPAASDVCKYFAT